MKLNAIDTKEMMVYVASQIVENEPFLTKIDLKIGDGDHGTGMKRGFSEVIKRLKDFEAETPEDVFKETGLTLIDSIGGASGVLFGTVFISGITKRESHGYFDVNDFAEIFTKSLDALKRRGKATVGDKTMVDSFEPAVDALNEASKKNMDLVDAMELAKDAANQGVENSKLVKAKFGRAKYFGDKAIGLQDAGATSIWIIFKAMSDWTYSLSQGERL